MNERLADKSLENYLSLFPECVVSAVAAEGLWPGLQANEVLD